MTLINTQEKKDKIMTHDIHREEFEEFLDPNNSVKILYTELRKRLDEVAKTLCTEGKIVTVNDVAHATLALHCMALTVGKLITKSDAVEYYNTMAEAGLKTLRALQEPNVNLNTTIADKVTNPLRYQFSDN